MHKIENISFNVELQNQSQEDYEKTYTDFIKYRFLPKVEDLFDKWSLAYPNVKCEIEEIELNVNLEILNEEELQKELVRQLTKQLVKINVTQPEQTEKIKVAITIKPSITEVFIQYLKTGSIPSYSTVREIKEWLQKVSKITKKQREQIRKEVSKNYITFQRLANVYREENYDKLIDIVTNRKEEGTEIQKQYIEEIVYKIKDQIQLKVTKKQFKNWIEELQKVTTIQQISTKIIELINEEEAIKQLTKIEREIFNLKWIYAQLRLENGKEIDIQFSEEIKIQKTVKKDQIEQIKEKLHRKQEFTKKEREQIQQIILESYEKFQKIVQLFKEAQQYRLIKKIIGINQEVFQKSDIKKIVQAIKEKLDLKFEKQPIQKWVEEIQTTKTIQKITEKFIELIKVEKEIVPLNNAEMEIFQQKLIYAKIRLEKAKSIDNIQLFREIKIQEQRISVQEEEIKQKQKENQKVLQKIQESQAETKTNKIVTEKAVENKEKTLKKEQNDQKETKRGKIVTEKAGIVILHPFIKELLKSAALITEENKIKDANKAALMLHYLATGNQKVLDLELSLEKMLLGIPMQQVIHIREKLTTKEKQQCEILLKAVIKHWKIYKSNAINSLRAMFLQRFATIEYTEKKINIKVEKQAQDLLLNRLPWGIGIIRLTWIKQLIYTKW